MGIRVTWVFWYFKCDLTLAISILKQLSFDLSYLLCISTSKRMLAHGRKRWKTFENHRKSKYFASCTWDAKKEQKNKIPNEQPAFECQPAFGSHSQSLTNKLFSSFFFMSLSHAWWKRYFFYDFRMFFIYWSKYTTVIPWRLFSCFAFPKFENVR